MLKGIPASPGISIGKAFLFDSQEVSVIKKKISKESIPKEISRFEEALIKTRSEILKIQDNISREMGVEHAEIFNAHLLVLEDRMIIDEVIKHLKKDCYNVEYVFTNVLKKYIVVFQKMDDEYLRERISDIEDVGKRMLRNLMGIKRQTLADIKEKVIVVAYDLSPSDTATMHKKNVTGFVTDIGGKTSHTAIMAKSLEIPAIVGLETVTKKIRNDDILIIDGTSGFVYINPDKKTLLKYQTEKRKYTRFTKDLEDLKDLPSETLDGRKVGVAANIELPEEITSVISHGAEGIGLYRTEYFYMNRNGLPDEEEQYKAYRDVAEKIAPHSVIIRTLDLGGDKFLSQLEVPKEMNPFLGWRAIRLSLAKPDLFKIQLRAILRASAHGKIRIMYPMISGLEEIEAANRLLYDAKEDLRRKNMPFDKNIEVGIMIEIPSAALIADILAKKVSFFSIGTNDLIQYSLAVDRVNEKIAYLYEPAHPGVLRLIRSIVEAAHKNNIWAGMCGEMAGEVAFVPLLVGLGLDEFSVPAATVPQIKKIMRSLTYKDAKKLAEKALQLSTGKEVEVLLADNLRDLIQGQDKQ
ncbi:MAG: phosphoenolpyruvate--protein phosphotransferase [Candidatus Omnitrophica bacterium]|nr:phosphoenolpyruvate--protein phosphotransferase [Candidatus Omnitrophota bacterium]